MPVATAGLAGLFALIGSGLGSFLSLRIFQKQRSFEARHRWYADVVRAFNDTANYAAFVASAFEAELAEAAAKELMGQLLDRQHKAMSLARENPLYATQRARTILAHLQVELNKIADDAGTPARMDRRATLFMGAADQFAHDGRRHFRLEALDRRSWRDRILGRTRR
ncbi:MAG: hypothetical protein IRY91_09505 [Gemmatimonadaceae bacterium]|nr:hypothetical protein [Gemmatimonadaceae bacterium]